MKKRLVNFWYYHRIHILIAVLILAAGGYLLLQQIGKVPADYEIAVVSGEYYSDEQLSALQAVFTAAGADLNGDGETVVQIHRYRLKIGENGQDAAEISALDADLVGKVSGLFLLENPSAFEEATNGICRSSDAVSCADTAELSGENWRELFLAVREEADEKYAAMLDALAA